jgi:Flp pilus assembly protein TadB
MRCVRFHKEAPAAGGTVLWMRRCTSGSRNVGAWREVMKFLVWIGIAMVICWGLLWLGIKIAVGAVHLLLLLGVVLIGWGLLHTGRKASGEGTGA